jgi:hypothetical protein
VGEAGRVQPRDVVFQKPLRAHLVETQDQLEERGPPGGYRWPIPIRRPRAAPPPPPAPTPAPPRPAAPPTPPAPTPPPPAPPPPPPGLPGARQQEHSGRMV